MDITIGVGGSPGVCGIIAILLGIFNAVVVLLIALALVLFIWGVIKFISSQDDQSARESARHQMINGIIALFVIVSVWGLVNVLINTFNLGNTVPSAPQVAPSGIDLPGLGDLFDFSFFDNCGSGGGIFDDLNL